MMVILTRFYLAAVEQNQGVNSLIFLNGCEIKSRRGKPGYEASSHPSRPHSGCEGATRPLV